MIIGTGLGLHGAATVALSVTLAFAFGYGLTMRGVLRAGVGLRPALEVALAADTVSIAVMELLDNGFILAVPGAMEAAWPVPCSGGPWPPRWRLPSCSPPAQPVDDLPRQGPRGGAPVPPGSCLRRCRASLVQQPRVPRDPAGLGRQPLE